ncbi:MAG: PAS-domain containing protein [Pseudomonadota bacterium]
MTSHELLNPADSVERQNEKLLKIAGALMRQVEQDQDHRGAAYAQFERAALLEQEVRSRTQDLERALALLNASNAKLSDANRATEEARADLADAIETLQEGFALFNADERLVMCNSRFCRQMRDLHGSFSPGLSFDAYVDLVSQSEDLWLPRGDTPEAWAEQRRARHAAEHSVFNVRLQGDRWIQVSERRTAYGGWVVIQTDITDIIRLEREERGKLLDEQARMIRATLDHINQGVCIFDQQGRLLGWNAKVGTLLSIPAQRFRLGADFRILLERLETSITFVPPMTPATLLLWSSRSAPRDPLSFEVQGRAGRRLAVFAQGMPDLGFVISFTDVTAEREASAALSEANERLEQRVTERTLELEDALLAAERANASKSRFVAAASHDLLQPLSAAKLYVSTLVENLSSATDRSIAQKSLSALNGVEGIIDALLDISRLDSDRAKAETTAFPLDRILVPLATEFAPAAELKGLTLRVLPTKVWVRSDPSYLRRIIQNLMSNAIRYTEQGKILVGARHQEGAVSIQVWDTGPGIAEEDQDRIFQEFQRLNAKASASDGMGLGLAIVERACALLGHPLVVTSRVGAGSGFHVRVPRTAAAGACASLGALPATRRSTVDDGPVVMLIENDEELRGALAAMLEAWGCVSLEAASADEAIEILDEVELEPDRYLVDYQLGAGRDGLEMIDEIRRRTPDARVRLVTADRSSALKSAAAERAVRISAKPIDPTELERFVFA